MENFDYVRIYSSLNSRNRVRTPTKLRQSHTPFLRQSLAWWPCFRHEKHNRCSLTLVALVSTGMHWNCFQDSTWWLPLRHFRFPFAIVAKTVGRTDLCRRLANGCCETARPSPTIVSSNYLWKSISPAGQPKRTSPHSLLNGSLEGTCSITRMELSSLLWPPFSRLAPRSVKHPSNLSKERKSSISTGGRFAMAYMFAFAVIRWWSVIGASWTSALKPAAKSSHLEKFPANGSSFICGILPS